MAFRSRYQSRDILRSRASRTQELFELLHEGPAHFRQPIESFIEGHQHCPYYIAFLIRPRSRF